MKEHPILFSGEMVKAILEGRKTQTRRVIKKMPCYDQNHYRSLISKCPYGQPGDRLWVRETWALAWKQDGCLHEGENIKCPCEGCSVEYKADTGNKYPGDWPEDMKDDDACGRWKPSIHMPRWASRITLEITNIRVERLQEISEEDQIKEGVNGVVGYSLEAGSMAGKPIYKRFAGLWNSINENKHPWSDNPWVWVIEFKKI